MQLLLCSENITFNPRISQRRFFALFGLWWKNTRLPPGPSEQESLQMGRADCAVVAVLQPVWNQRLQFSPPQLFIYFRKTPWATALPLLPCTAANKSRVRVTFLLAHRWIISTSSLPQLRIYPRTKTKEWTTAVFISALLKALRKSATLLWENTDQIFGWNNKQEIRGKKTQPFSNEDALPPTVSYWSLGFASKQKKKKTTNTYTHIFLFLSFKNNFYWFSSLPWKKTHTTLKEKETIGFVWNWNWNSGRGLVVKAQDTKGQTQKSHNTLTGERDPVLSSTMRPRFKPLFHLMLFEFTSFIS